MPYLNWIMNSIARPRFLVLTTLVAFTLVGCGGEEDTDNNDTSDVGIVDDAGGEDTGGEDTGGEDTGGEDAGGEDTGGEDTGGEDTGGEDNDVGETCGEGLDECNEDCVDFQTDPDHCGGCEDSACDPGQTCEEGECTDESVEAVSFADDVVPIFGTCAGCHGGSGGLTLAEDPYEEIVEVDSPNCADRVRVVPGDADGSYIIHKLEGGPDICGSQMPLSGSVTNEQIDTLRQWIDEGALDN